MKFNSKKLTIILLITLLTGCSSDEDKKAKSSSTQKVATASGIEISQNENAKEIKVEEKDHDKKDKQ